MRLWLVNSSEPTPLDAGPFRLRRMGMLAEMAVQQGHQVVWWTSTFCHVTKAQRASEGAVKVREDYHIHFMGVPPYQKNVSIARIRNHHHLARRFAEWAIREETPDVILCSFPTLELSDRAVQLGHKLNVPTVLDIRDLWPDVMLELLPEWSKPIGRRMLTPYYRMARSACSGATAVWGCTDEFVEWGLQCGNRRRTAIDRDFPFGYKPLSLSDEATGKADRFWNDLGVGVTPEVPVVCFFGSINRQFDLETVLEAADQLAAMRPVQFVFCGDGEYLSHYRCVCNGKQNIFFPGWVNAEQIWSLMSRSTFGLAPYIENVNFANNLTNKPIEYLAGGLPILCSLTCGPLYKLTTQENCGVVYGSSASRLAQVIEEVLSSPECYSALARNARRVFAERFEASRVYGEMLNQLVALAAGPTDSYATPRAA